MGPIRLTRPQAIDLAAECVHYTVLTDPERPSRVHTLASLLGTRSQLFSSPNDLDGSIHHYATILDPSSPASFTTIATSHKRSGSLGAGGQETWMYEYSQRLAERYEQRGDQNDLWRAEVLCKSALEQKGLDGTALAERQSHLAYLLQYKSASPIPLFPQAGEGKADADCFWCEQPRSSPAETPRK
jgi:hypothetical protein